MYPANCNSSARDVVSLLSPQQHGDTVQNAPIKLIRDNLLLVQGAPLYNCPHINENDSFQYYNPCLSLSQKNPPLCSNIQSIWSWSSNSKVLGVASGWMRSPSTRKRSELACTPLRWAYVSNTFDIFVDFLILKYVSSPVCDEHRSI